MSGPENLRGIDYQICCTLLLVLNALVEDTTFAEVKCESIDDEGEDLSFYYTDSRHLEIQVKKLAEGYNWTPASLRPILQRFSQLPSSCDCLFLSDGSASKELGPLKDFLETGGVLRPEVINAVCNAEFTEPSLKSLAGRVRVSTRHFPSPDDADPARSVRAEIERAIIAGPFVLTGVAREVAERLWAVVFRAAKAAKKLSRDEVLCEFSLTGLAPAARKWSQYPTAKHFYDHEYSLEEATARLTTGGVTLVTGIGGSGKSTLIAEAAAIANEGRRASCWLTLSPLFEPEDVISQIGQYCRAVGLPDLQASLASAERVAIPSSIAGMVAAFPISIVLDRLEAATPRARALIEGIVTLLPSANSRGSLTLIAREIPVWWDDVLRDQTQAVHVGIAGLPLASALSMLRDREIGESDDERNVLAAKVGRHAQSLSLLTQFSAADSRSITTTRATDVAEDWLLRRVLQELPDLEREALQRLSIFSYSAPYGAALAALDPLGQLQLRSLQRRELVRVELNNVTIHDAIRSVAEESTPASLKMHCHRVVAEYFFSEIMQEFERDEEVSFDKSIPWALHLRVAHNTGKQEHDKLAVILEADDELLLALFGIDRLGFPFAFGDVEKERAIVLAEELEDAGLVEINPINEGLEYLKGPMFRLVGFSFYDRLLITSLCYHEGLAASLGYFEETRPNFAFAQQGLACPWEHCIELFPLPGISRAEWEEGVERDKERLLDAEAHGLTDKHIEVLKARIAESLPDWVTEHVDEELRDRACPFFGHACPAGRDQAHTCREHEEFEWAGKVPGNEVAPLEEKGDSAKVTKSSDG